MTALCALPGIGEGRTKPPVPAPANRELEQMVFAVPPMAGAEYLTISLLADLWHRIDAAFDAELAVAKLTVQEFLKGRHPAWNLVGRVHFNLAENRKDEDAPFAFLTTYVLSVKAGGAGLNLTAASHVIHFDRWWNPAVENQATDRAFRIGQTRNVLVHKFVCQGTVEDRIDQMIESKKQLAGDFLEGGADMQLTELKDEELLKLVVLDLGAAMTET